MTAVNLTKCLDVILTLDVPDFNVSTSDDLNSISELDENATQLILRNGTRTRSPKGRGPIFQAVTLLNLYAYPIIVVIGLLSNLLAYLVFTRTRLRKVPSIPYLAAMSVADSGALLTDVIMYGLLQHKIQVITWVGVCQYTTFFHYGFFFLCVWYPVALCVEKFICVYCPLRKVSLCTPFRAKVVVIGMAVMTGTCYFYIVYMVGPTRFGTQLICREWEVFRNDFQKLMKLDMIFACLLPSVVLIVLLILICGRGCEYYRISSTVEVPSRAGTQRNASILSPVRVTNVIFPVVLVMLLLRMPANLIRFYGLVWNKPPARPFVEMQPILLYVSKLDLAIKLYLYLIFSPGFRRRTRSFLCSLRAKLKGQCTHESSEDLDVEGIPIGPRIALPENPEAGGNARGCLMVSDV